MPDVDISNRTVKGKILVKGQEINFYVLIRQYAMEGALQDVYSFDAAAAELSKVKLQIVLGDEKKVAIEYKRPINPQASLTPQLTAIIEKYERPVMQDKENKLEEQADKELYKVVFASLREMFGDYEVLDIQPSKIVAEFFRPSRQRTYEGAV